MSAVPAPRPSAGSRSELDWDKVALRAPKLAATMRRYLTQAATFLAPLSIDSADNALRLLVRWLLDHTEVRALAEVTRDDIEDFKVWLAGRPGIKGQPLSANTQRQRLRMLRMFFERIIEWDWPDAPIRNPIIGGDIPPRPEPLPKFLDDRDAAKVMAAARAATDPRDRLVVEVLARTGLRASELCDLDADAVVRIGDGHWLRVPVGKLRNERFIPLHPDLVALLAGWCADNLDRIRAHHGLIADDRGSIDRHQVGRVVRRVARRVGVTAHPHQLRQPNSVSPNGLMTSVGMPLQARRRLRSAPAVVVGGGKHLTRPGAPRRTSSGAAFGFAGTRPAANAESTACVVVAGAWHAWRDGD